MLPLKTAQLQEASQMLTDILQVRVKQAGDQHVSVGEAACVLTLLYLCLSDSSSARQSFQGAQALLQGASKFAGLLAVTQSALRLAA